MFDFLFNISKRKEDNIGYAVGSDIDLVQLHHFIRKDFNTVLVDLTTKGDELRGFIERFAKEYNMYVRINSDKMAYILECYTKDRNSEYYDIMDEINEILSYSNLLKGIIFEIGTNYIDTKKAVYNLTEVFLKRILKLHKRVGIRIIIGNGSVKENHENISLSTLLVIRRELGIELCLNSYNTSLHNRVFIDTLMGDANRTYISATKDFDFVELYGISEKKEKKSPCADKDVYTLYNYKNLFSQLRKNTIVFIGGDLDNAIALKKHLI
jgi:hypothetical protein